MLYKDFDTNEIYTIEELEEMLSQGRQGIGGLVEA